MQNILLRKVADNVGQYQTSVSDTVRRYKRRKKNSVNLKTINREGTCGVTSQLTHGDLIISQRTEDARQPLYDCL